MTIQDAVHQTCTQFAKDCTQSLNEFELPTGVHNLTHIRQTLLAHQAACLQRTVQAWNSNHTETITVEQVQVALRNSPSQGTINSALEGLNESARQAFCRCVLQSQCRRGNDGDSALIKSGKLPRQVFLEFCGLCQTALRLPVVQRYLNDGTELFEDETAKIQTQNNTATSIYPHVRFERVQFMFVRALSYDPDFVKSEMERLFVHEAHQSEFTNDKEAQSAFRELVASIQRAVQQATRVAHERAFSTDDGTTRVVSVQYSERLVDAETGETLPTTEADAPTQQRMHHEQPAAALQQEILGELLALRDEERQSRLVQAAATAQRVQEQLVALADPLERVQFLKSLGSETQRTLLMHRLWQGLLQRNGGQEPNIRFAPNHHHHA